MAAALLGKTEISVKKFGQACTVPNNAVAKLMYYFNCICVCVEPDQSATIRRLRDYNNYASLSSDEEAQLIALCLTLSPDKLMGTVLFPVDDCGDSSNEFLELSAVSTRLVVAESLLIGGQRRRIKKIMMLTETWMERNYIEPLRSIICRPPARPQIRYDPQPTRPQPRYDPPPRQQPKYNPPPPRPQPKYNPPPAPRPQPKYNPPPAPRPQPKYNPPPAPRPQPEYNPPSRKRSCVIL